MSRTGMSGFDGDGQFDLIAGSVTGIRWWSVSPADTRLIGMREPWHPGQNEATCSVKPVPHVISDWNDIAWVNGVPTRLSDIPPPPSPVHQPPEENCGCGFWAYWDLGSNQMNLAITEVCGIIEGTGRVLIGEKGFRCQYATIIALHIPYPDYPLENSYLGEQRYKNAPTEWLRTRNTLPQHYPGVPLYGTLAAMLEEHPTDRGDAL